MGEQKNFLEIFLANRLMRVKFFFSLRSSEKFRPKSFFEQIKIERSETNYFMFIYCEKKLNLTSEFNEVYFSERRNFEASHKIPTSKNKFWGAGETLGVLGEADPANR